MTETDSALLKEPGDEDWRQKWAEMLQHARTRPAMYVGDPAAAHLHLVSDVIRLVWKAKAFRKPQSVHVDLSPTQCAARANTGPLIRPIQRMFSYPGGQRLGESWFDESRAYFKRLEAEDEERGLSWGKHRWRSGWRYCFAGPTGPRLGEPSYPSVLARRLTWGLRTDEGIWCQSYDQGWPAGAPFLVSDPSPVGLFVLADLASEWLTGLPYNAENVAQLRAASHRSHGGGSGRNAYSTWTNGEIVVNWHEQDDLVTERSLTAEGVREWLSVADPGGEILI